MRRNDRLSVAIVMPVFSTQESWLTGGGERYAYQVARALRDRCDVTLVTFGPRSARTEVDGLKQLVVRARGTDPENPFPNPGFFLTQPFDIVHVFQLRSLVTSLAALIAPLRRFPLVVTDVGGGGRSLMFRLQLYRLIRRFVLISDFSRQLLPRAVWPRSAVVKGGIDLDRFKHREGGRYRRVLQVGRIMPHKGMNYLIEACGADIPLVIAGRVKDPDYYRYLQELSKDKQVTFVLDPDDATVAYLYRTATVTAGPSVYRDVFGNEWPTSELLGLTMLESMAVGTPVVCTAVGGMPEYVVDGVTGFIVPPNDTVQLRERIQRILKDGDLATTMGSAGVEHVRQYSWDSVAAGIVEEYGRARGAPKAN